MNPISFSDIFGIFLSSREFKRLKYTSLLFKNTKIILQINLNFDYPTKKLTTVNISEVFLC